MSKLDLELGAVLEGKAMSGDLYIFRNLKYKCPGNMTDDNLGSLVSEIE